MEYYFLDYKGGTKVKLTEEQKESIKVLKERWDHVSEPRKLPCDDAVLVEVKSDETGVGMFIGIETDGHRHS